MKNILLLSLIGAATLSGQQLSLNFTSYTSSSIVGQDGWTVNASNTDAAISNATPLIYAGYGSGGKYISVPGNASVTYFSRALASSITLASPGTIYYALLARMTSADALGRYCFNLDGSPSAFSHIWVRDAGSSKWNLGISKNGSSLVWGASSFNYNQTYLIMVRYTINAGANDDEAFAWVNPPLTGEPGTVSAEVVSGSGQVENSQTSFSGIRIYTWSNTPVWQLDDIRVGYGTTSAAAFLDMNYDGSLPVEMQNFSASILGGTVQLNWHTAAEVNNAGFEIQKTRRHAANGIKSWEKIAFVKGCGTTATPQSYTYSDKPGTGSFAYRLKQIDRNGDIRYSSVAEAEITAVPAACELKQNFPNPFNPTTNITFVAGRPEYTTLNVYNLLGQHVASLYKGITEAGREYTAAFNASRLSGGVYFYKLETASHTEMRKMQLLK